MEKMDDNNDKVIDMKEFILFLREQFDEEDDEDDIIYVIKKMVRQSLSPSPHSQFDLLLLPIVPNA